MRPNIACRRMPWPRTSGPEGSSKHSMFRVLPALAGLLSPFVDGEETDFIASPVLQCTSTRIDTRSTHFAIDTRSTHFAPP